MAWPPLRVPRLGCLGMLLLACASLGATSLRTAPTRIILDAGLNATEVSVSNTSDAPLFAQVRLYAWTQQDGHDRLLPTREMAVSPPLIEIPPHQQQLVRVIRLGTTSTDHEGSYRIIIDQLPRQEVQGPQTVLRYSAPLFAPPHAPGTHRLSASLQGQGSDWLLRIDNQGSRHARLADLEYRDANGKRLPIARQLAGYVLPGQFKTWPLPARAEGYGEGGFTAKVNQDAHELPLTMAVAH